MRSTVWLILLLVSLTNAAHAQSFAHTWHGSKVVEVELLHPFFDGESEIWNVAGFLSARFPASDVAVVAELPFAHARFDDPFSGNNETSLMLGNPYVGLESLRGDVIFDMGVRLPIAPGDEPAALMGLFSDFNRFEAFGSDVFTARAGLEYVPQTTRPTLGISLDGVWLWSTEGGGGELFIDYGGRMLQRGTAVGFEAGILGRMILTGSGGSFGNRTLHQLLAGIDFALKPNLRPGLEVRVPLEEGITDWVAGLGVQVILQ